MPGACYTGAGSGGYVLKHNPFGFFRDEYSGPCHILPYPGASGLLAALNGANAPDFVWVTPSLLNDMHDGSVQMGDAWLQSNIGPVLASAWFKNFSSTVVISMDEASGDSTNGGGHVPFVVVSGRATGKGNTGGFGNHYGALRSIEEVFGLTLLGAASNSANGDVSALFGS